MRLRATIRLRNDAMITARKALGLSQRQLADAAGVPYTAVCCLEALNFKGECVMHYAMQLADFLEIDPEMVMPEAMVGERIESTQTAVHEMSPQQLLAVCGERNALPAPDARLLEVDTKDEIQAAMGELTDVEREVLSRRFGLDGGDQETLEQVGRAVRVSRERVRQIEARAMRKVRDYFEHGPQIEETDGESPSPAQA